MDLFVSLVITLVMLLVGASVLCFFGWMFDLLFGRKVDAWRAGRDARPYRAKPQALRRDFLLACIWMELGGVLLLLILGSWIHPIAAQYSVEHGIRTRNWDAQWFVTIFGTIIAVFSAYSGWLNMSIWRDTRKRDRRDMPQRLAREQKEQRRHQLLRGHGLPTSLLDAAWFERSCDELIADDHLRWVWRETYEHFYDWRTIAEFCMNERIRVRYDALGPNRWGEASPGRYIHLRDDLEYHPDSTIAATLVHESIHCAWKMGLVNGGRPDAPGHDQEGVAVEWMNRAERRWAETHA